VFEPAGRSPAGRGTSTVWSVFPADTRYFEPSAAGFMINYRVEDLDEVLAALRAEGCAVDERIEASEYGRFGWVADPEGNRVELWEPPLLEGESPVPESP
jgi:catechol 2,3-dioxygenase-like lactoylglutathione lyase family enzyme